MRLPCGRGETVPVLSGSDLHEFSMSQKRQIGKIFINYRREDASAFAGRIFDHLNNYFPSDQLFMDVVGIPPGKNFVDELNQQIAQCVVFLCVIGEHWLGVKDVSGNCRLESDADIVRKEIELALRRNILIIPILANKALMPNQSMLPKSLQPLALFQAIHITHEHFEIEIRELVQFIEGKLKEVEVDISQYKNLECLLRLGKWQDANEETKALIQKLAPVNLLTIGSEELKVIDRLWVKYSNGLFGFSIQKQILLDVNGDLKEFWRRVVWLNRFSIWSEKTLKSGLIFESHAPRGHLPFILDLNTFPVLKAAISGLNIYGIGGMWIAWLIEDNEKIVEFKTFLLRRDL